MPRFFLTALVIFLSSLFEFLLPSVLPGAVFDTEWKASPLSSGRRGLPLCLAAFPASLSFCFSFLTP